MTENNYDEYQLSVRYKTASVSLALTFVLLFINSFIADYYVWGESVVQVVVIMSIVFGYYLTVTISKGAFLCLDGSYRKMMFIYFGIALLNVVVVITGCILDGVDHFVSNGILDHSSCNLFMGILSLYAGVLQWIYLRKEKSNVQ